MTENTGQDWKLAALFCAFAGTPLPDNTPMSGIIGVHIGKAMGHVSKIGMLTPGLKNIVTGMHIGYTAVTGREQAAKTLDEAATTVADKITEGMRTMMEGLVTKPNVVNATI